MSDVDSLDELLDDIDDIKSGPDADTIGDTSIDLDALLDDAAEEYDKTEQQVDEDDDLVEDGGIAGHMHSSEERAVDSALLGVPFHMRKKWTEFLHADISVAEGAEYVSSYAYRSWSEERNKFSIDKSLKEMVMRVSSKCGLNDAQSKEVENAVMADPVMKSQYIAQIIADRKTQILSDPNYDPNIYPMLAKVLQS
jgi:hypothetical protein